MFYTVNQNNSGGVTILNDDVLDFVIVEADNVEEASSKFREILGEYRSYCPCCGPRWYDDCLGENDADEVPSIYGDPYVEFLATEKDYTGVVIYYKGPASSTLKLVVDTRKDDDK